MGRGHAIDHRRTGALGLVAIGAYGSWYYAFGALLDAIAADTGWGEASLAGSYAAGTVLVGVGSVLGGRLLDRAGVRPVLIAGGIGGTLSLLAAAAAGDVVTFTVASALGMGLYGALGFYHVTMTAAVRVNPHAPASAIAVVSLWGALASAVYLPLAAALVRAVEWRMTVRILGLSAGALFLLAAAVVPERRRAPATPGATTVATADPPDPGDDPIRPGGPGKTGPSLARVLSSALAAGAPRRYTAAVACAGVALSTLLVYQVPAMTAAGLSLGTASTVAGLRGLSQLGGRLPLAAVVRRLGTGGAFRVAFTTLAAGGALLAVSGSVPVALVFAAAAGFGIGAYSPLQGIGAEELFPRDTLGATMGFHGSVLMLAGAVGPGVTGVLADATGDRRWSSLVIVAAAVGAFAFVSGVWPPVTRRGVGRARS